METNDLRKAAEMALEALKDTHYRIIDAGLLDQDLLNRNFTVATALRQALAQEYNHESLRLATKDYIQELEDRVDEYTLKEEQQKPVAWMYVNTDGECEQIEYGEPFDDPSVTPLYTTPPKREWVGLTDMEIEDIYEQEGCADIVLLTEAKLKEKNT